MKNSYDIILIICYFYFNALLIWFQGETPSQIDGIC